MNYSHVVSTNFALRTFQSILLLLAFLSFAIGVSAQTSITTASDATTPKGLAAGAAAGSYSLSGFENVNLYNGNLNFRLPLVHVGGRGSAGYTMMLALNSKKWSVNHSQTETSESWSPTNISWADNDTGYGPGVLRGRQTGFDLKNTAGCSGLRVKFYDTTLTTLTFTGPDGTE